MYLLHQPEIPYLLLWSERFAVIACKQTEEIGFSQYQGHLFEAINLRAMSTINQKLLTNKQQMWITPDASSLVHRDDDRYR